MSSPPSVECLCVPGSVPFGVLGLCFSHMLTWDGSLGPLPKAQVTQIWSQGSRQSWLGLCMVAWLLLPRTLGLRRPRKASDSLYRPNGRLLVSGGLPYLPCFLPGVWEDPGSSGDPLEDCSALQYGLASHMAISVSLSLASVPSL